MGTIFGGPADDQKARSIGETLGPESAQYTLLVHDMGIRNGESINEPWALFGGRLGRQQHNNFESATYVNGSHLSDLDWDYVKLVDWFAEALNKLPENVIEGIGPEGPGARDFVKNSALQAIEVIAPVG